MVDIEKVRRGWNSEPEHSYWVPHCDIEGVIPNGLRGTFIRNGPGLNEVYGKKLKHPIDGDGLICKVTIVDGNVHFQSRFVGSKHRLEEKKTKKFIYPGQMGTRNKKVVSDTLSTINRMLTGKYIPLEFRNPSNTNAFYWGGKILSLYETHMPYCLDPYTLDTLGIEDFRGNCPFGNVGVHFRIDSDAMNLVMFSLNPGVGRLPRLQIHEFDPQWHLQKRSKFSIPWLNYAHDFLLFPDYYLFHITPFTDTSKWLGFKILSGWTSPGESMKYYPDHPSRFVVIPRNAKNEEEIIFVDTDPCHIFHYGTAEQVGKKLKFNAVCLDKTFNMQFSQNMWLSNADVSPGFVFNYELDLTTKTCSRVQIDTSSTEFPTSHPYRNGHLGTRFIYLMASDRKELLPFRDVIKLDTRTLKKTVWYSDGVIGEPVFVPRYGYESRVVGDEDDGYVMVQLYHPEKNTTDFCVLDAKCVNKGPIARIKLKHHVPYGFHGTFTPEVFISENKKILLLHSKL